MADSPIYQMLLERGKTELDAALKDCEKLIDVLDRNGIASLVAIANKDYEQLEELRDSLEHADGPDASAWGAVKFATFRVKKDEKDALYFRGAAFTSRCSRPCHTRRWYV